MLLLIDLSPCKFFCPSMRLEHKSSSLNPSSLVISSSASLAPFSGKQCTFVKSLTMPTLYHARVGISLRLNEESAYYNCVEFLSKYDSDEKEGKILIQFFHDFIEVFVDRSEISPAMQITSTACSKQTAFTL